MKKYLSMILLVFLMALSACGEKKEEQNETEKPAQEKKEMPVIVEKIQKKNIQKRVSTNSELVAIEEVPHVTKYGGDVEEVYYKNGNRVKKGDVVIKLSDDNITMNYKSAKASYTAAKSAYEEVQKFAEKRLRNQYATAKSNLVNAEQNLERVKRGADSEELAQARSAMEAAKKNYEVQKNTYEKYKTLYEKKLVSETEYLNIENAYKSAESKYIQAKNQLDILLRGEDRETILKLESALSLAKEQYELSKKYVEEKSWEYEIEAKRSQYESAKSSYEYAKTVYNELIVKAEISGVIVDLDLTKKTTAKKESHLFTIIDDSKMEGKSGISGEDLPGIEVGNEITVLIGDTNKEYKGIITEINPKADRSTRKFAVKFTVENDGMLRSGMYSKVEIPSIVKETLVVPAKTVVIKDLAEYIFLTKDNKAMKVKIKTGISTDEEVEIISDKIKEGDMIVVDGQYLLEDRDNIRIVENR